MVPGGSFFQPGGKISRRGEEIKGDLIGRCINFYEGREQRFETPASRRAVKGGGCLGSKDLPMAELRKARVRTKAGTARSRMSLRAWRRGEERGAAAAGAHLAHGPHGAASRSSSDGGSLSQSPGRQKWIWDLAYPVHQFVNPKGKLGDVSANSH